MLRMCITKDAATFAEAARFVKALEMLGAAEIEVHLLGTIETTDGELAFTHGWDAPLVTPPAKAAKRKTFEFTVLEGAEKARTAVVDGDASVRLVVTGSVAR
jgi:hypothetical protein